MSSTYLYFAYGSNLLAKRIHINNPSAKRKDCGFIKNISDFKNFRLDFGSFSKRWQGAASTIAPEPDSKVWGAVWEMNEAEKHNLDNQEGVHIGMYFPLEVEVESPKGYIYKCRTYQQCNLPTDGKSLSDLPDERKPSMVYISMMIKGAEESKLPEEYIEMLRNVPHNGYAGNVNLNDDN